MLVNIFEMTSALAIIFIFVILFKTDSTCWLLLSGGLEVDDGLVALEEDGLSNHVIIILIYFYENK